MKRVMRMSRHTESDIKEEYIISVIGKQTANNEASEIALTSLGSFKYNGDRAVVMYYEYDEDNPNIKTKAILNVDGNKLVTMTKTGNIRSQIILEKGKRHLCYYSMEEGNFTIGICTEEIDVDLNENGGCIKAVYTLDVNSNIASYNTIQVVIEKIASDK